MAEKKIPKSDREYQNARLVLEFLFEFCLDSEFKKKIQDNFKKNNEFSLQEKEQFFTISYSQENKIWKISGKYYDTLVKNFKEGFNYQVLYNYMNKEYREKIVLPDRGEKKDPVEAVRKAFYWLISKKIIIDITDKKNSQARLFEGLSDVKDSNLSFNEVKKELDDIFTRHIPLPNIAERAAEARAAETINDLGFNIISNEEDAYLILQIKTSASSNSNNKNYTILAWLDDGIRTEQLGQENNISKIMIRQVLGQWVGQSRQRTANNQRLLIEVYVSDDLLEETYEHWEYHCDGLIPEQLRENYLVYIRWQERWSLAKKYDYQIIWEKRWNTFRYSPRLNPHIDQDWYRHIRQENNLWFNACRIDKSMKDYVKKFTMHGMPIALWSRCRGIDHWDEVNSLVAGSSYSQLPINVLSLRQEAPTEISENSIELGHHLTLMWEDPRRCPPWEDAKCFGDENSAFSS